MIEPLGDAAGAQPLHRPGKNIPNHPGGIGVLHQMVLVLRILGITVHGKVGDARPLAAFHLQVGAHLDGDVPAVGVVDQVLKGHHNAVRTRSRQGIVPIVYRNETNAQLGKDLFNVFAAQDVIPAKPG